MARTAQQALAESGIEFDVKPITIVDTQQSIDPISQNTDLNALAMQEQFMREVLSIRVATTTDQNAPPFVTLTVNDVNNRVQVHRGVPTLVRRMHVEVLARMNETRFSQRARNMADPESGNELLAQHGTCYPFEVLHDPNPRGPAWLQHILAESK